MVKGANSPFGTGMESGYESVPTLSWRQSIVWPNLCYNFVVLCLLITTLTLSAITFSRVEEVATCRLGYEGNANDVTERQLQSLAKEAGWVLTHPEAPDCNRCSQNDRYPVWMAPVDICTRFELPETHWLCNGNSNLPSSHIKVCATQTQIDQAWTEGGCHFINGNLTTPHIAWDGALFCSVPYCSYLSRTGHYQMKYGQECYCQPSELANGWCKIYEYSGTKHDVYVNNDISWFGELGQIKRISTRINCEKEEYQGVAHTYVSNQHLKRDGTFYFDYDADRLICRKPE